MRVGVPVNWATAVLRVGHAIVIAPLTSAPERFYRSSGERNGLEAVSVRLQFDFNLVVARPLAAPPVRRPVKIRAAVLDLVIIDPTS